MEIRNLLNAFHRIENSPSEVSSVASRLRSYSSSPSLDASATSAGDHADLRITKAFSSADEVRADKIKATQAAIQGGNVRVGLEDSLSIGRGQLAESNAEQVGKIRRILEELGYSIATAAEAREILALKGGDRVRF